MAQPRDVLTELEFCVADSSYPFVRGSAAASCQCVLRELLPRSDESYLEFFEVRDGQSGALAAAVADFDDVDAHIIDERDGAGIVVFRIYDSCKCVATTLADQGSFLRELRAEDGRGRIVAEVPPSRDAGAVAASIADAHPSVDLVAKRERPAEGSIFVRERFRSAVDGRLTERQREVLAAAYFGGYFERPRETTGTDLAARLDISPSTFSQHLRAAQRKVMAALLEEGFAAGATDLDEHLDPAFEEG